MKTYEGFIREAANMTDTIDDPHLNGPHRVRLDSFGPNDAGFGIVIATGARCFVSNHFVEHFDLVEDDEITVRLQVNTNDRAASRTPYEVKYVYPSEAT